MTTGNCEKCGVLITGVRQETFPGMAPKHCLDCQSYERAVHLLKMLPVEEENDWDKLNSWEQNFLNDMRRKIEGMKKISSAQYDKIDQIYEKLS